MTVKALGRTLVPLKRLSEGNEANIRNSKRANNENVELESIGIPQALPQMPSHTSHPSLSEEEKAGSGGILVSYENHRYQSRQPLS